VITTEYEGRSMVAARVDRRLPKVEEGEKGQEGKKREKGNGCEGGKRWNLLELSCAC
jgi:hypothetical protein